MGSLTIRSGAQSGVDRSALDYAVRHNIPYAGWCPRGGWAEDFTTPPGLLVRYPRLVETPSTDTSQRTAWNARDSHATMILLPAGNVISEGTLFTQRCAELVFMRPCIVIPLGESNEIDEANRRLSQIITKRGLDQFVLNIAGPRGSEAPGIYDQARHFLERLDLVGIFER